MIDVGMDDITEGPIPTQVNSQSGYTVPQFVDDDTSSVSEPADVNMNDAPSQTKTGQIDLGPYFDIQRNPLHPDESPIESFEVAQISPTIGKLKY